MRVGDVVDVKSKDALAPYAGTVAAVGDGTVDVRSADGTMRTHPTAQCVVIAEAEAPVEVVATGETVPVAPVAPAAPVKKAGTPRTPRKPKAAK